MPNRSINVRRPLQSVVLSVAALALAAACGQASAAPGSGLAETGLTASSSPASSAPASSAPAASSTVGSAASSTVGSAAAGSSVSYPLTLTNCGHQVTVNSRPERILAIKSTSLELLLALGVGDRVIGRAFSDGPVPAEWAAAAEKIPVISGQAPAQEPVLALAPDLIVAGWESNLAADTAGTPQTLAAKGIAAYVEPSACKEPAARPGKLTFTILFGEIAEMGRLVDARAAAANLVAQQQQQLAALGKAKPGTTALWWSSGTDTPYVGGGIGAPQMAMDAVGLTNIAGDIDDTWSSLGWESIIAANPNVIVLVDASWNPAQSKIARLEADPVAAKLDAVVYHRYVVIPFAAGEAGVRSVSAAATLSRSLAGWGLLR